MFCVKKKAGTRPARGLSCDRVQKYLLTTLEKKSEDVPVMGSVGSRGFTGVGWVPELEEVEVLVDFG